MTAHKAFTSTLNKFLLSVRCLHQRSIYALLSVWLQTAVEKDEEHLVVTHDRQAWPREIDFLSGN